eukprot:TRINITY_DN20020_c0_g1_i1.p1 TRINITY_DN20020_c0_g1~~TRINITY_DN20020_c0_g1_i1.p1  ORF type:complete len:1709 (+),score=246.49 TRINITY_DN20020_c0_g1_i1:135-5261(+)
MRPHVPTDDVDTDMPKFDQSRAASRAVSRAASRATSPTARSTTVENIPTLLGRLPFRGDAAASMAIEGSCKSSQGKDDANAGYKFAETTARALYKATEEVAAARKAAEEAAIIIMEEGEIEEVDSSSAPDNDEEVEVVNLNSFKPPPRRDVCQLHWSLPSWEAVAGFTARLSANLSSRVVHASDSPCEQTTTSYTPDYISADVPEDTDDASSLGQSINNMGRKAPAAARRSLIDRVCNDLQSRLGLQYDSVRNQAEHVHALWESFVDRHRGPSVALHDLGKQLLRSQMEWWEKVWCPLTGTGVHECADPEHTADDVLLRDICLFLLLWGELGNLRFCPELGCFLFASARSYLAGPVFERKPEGAFLEEVVKPIFNVILFETFEPGLPPKFKFGKAPAPADACNYDDWNELFWDPFRIKRALKLQAKGGEQQTRLHTASRKASEVWTLLPDVDWLASLRDQKSHRELHSFLPLLVGFYRIWLLLSLSFAGLVLLRVNEPFANKGYLEWSALGLIAPSWLFLYHVGFQLLTPKISWKSRFACFFKLIAYMIPVATYALERFSAEQQILILGIGELPNSIAVALHTAASTMVLLLALSPSSQNLYDWRFYPSSFGQLGIPTALFWFSVFGAKVAFDYLVTPRLGFAIDKVWHMHALGDVRFWLVLPQLAVLILPAALSSFASLSFFEKIVIAVTGALRGIRILGGFKLCCYRRGIGLTHMPAKITHGVLHLPKQQQDATRYEATRWWNNMSDHELGAFVEIWNCMMTELRERDLISDAEMNTLSFESKEAVRHGRLPKVLDPLNVFDIRNILPVNQEARRRIVGLARAAQMRPLPPSTLRQCPSMTVLIPHYTETIRYDRDDLFTENGSAELLQFLVKYYSDEFRHFASRVRHLGGCDLWNAAPAASPANGAERNAQLVELNTELCKWASLRMQTLWRTIEGICLAYSKALSAVCKQQEPSLSQAECEELVRKKFQLVVAMQRYAKFSDPNCPAYDIRQAAAAEAILQTFGSWLSIAYIDEKDEPEGRRYYSCLVDSNCPRMTESQAGMREAKFTVELPGFPIMGHGKSDNQNCALIFTRGELLQAIDANQDAYFEASLFLPRALQEFTATCNGRRPGILGFREHIFSNVGIMGRIAADNEFAFGTVVQRTMDWPMGCRMHYGHPDIMDKIQMLQQGGVSKGTRGLNLSEDIFSGIDLMLRGGWTAYREYFHVGKGRDMGFMSVLSFTAKVSMGNGEQAITRQWMRMGLHLPLARLLGIFYVHVGWYLNQCFVTWSLQAFSFMAAYAALGKQVDIGIPSGAMQLTTSYFGSFYVGFMLASMLPLILEELIENGLRAALRSIASSVLALSPVFAAFQSKLMAHFFESTVHYGGAQYIPTGRGLATAHEPFAKLFRTFSATHFADGFELAVLIVFSSGTDYGMAFYMCIGLTIMSWTFAPFLFNPKQFATTSQVCKDFRDWARWMCKGAGKADESWVTWATELQAVRANSSIVWVLVPSARFLAAACSTALLLHLEPIPPFGLSIQQWFPLLQWIRSILVFLPPLAHFVLCFVLSPLELSCGIKPPYACMAVLAIALTCCELYFMQWQTASLAVVAFHKYMCVRFMLEAADDTVAHRLGGCLLRPLQRALSSWALSFRFVRDAVVGIILAVCCVAFAAIPGLANVHLWFLFRTNPGAKKKHDDKACLQENDCMLLEFFQEFAPQLAQHPLERP